MQVCESIRAAGSSRNDVVYMACVGGPAYLAYSAVRHPDGFGDASPSGSEAVRLAFHAAPIATCRNGRSNSRIAGLIPPREDATF